jgi:hypothetical protein
VLQTLANPLRVTICHCRFCQRFTGSSYLIEPIFRKQDVVFEGARAKVYEHRSDSSGKRIALNFCGRCATTLCLDLERFPDALGLCVARSTIPIGSILLRAYRHIFVRSAQKSVILPAGVDLYEGHALQLDGSPNQPIVLAHALAPPNAGPAF